MKKNKKSGSGLFLVLIIATALSVGTYSVLDLVNGEFRLNRKALLHNEAKQAAETILQSSIADLKERFDSQTAFPIDALSPSNNPLYISNEFTSMHGPGSVGSYLVIPQKLAYTSTSDFNSQKTEVIGGQIPPGQWRYIDPRIPGNQFDELAGTRVFERSIEMVSKATVERPEIGSSTVYARQFLQVRDAPLFAYAIFYNVPMEIAPGPKMKIYGNVHSNSDSWFQSSGGLDFFSKVTLAGDLIHGRNPDSGKGDSYGSVRIPNASGELINLKKDTSWGSEQQENFGGDWLTSSFDDFYDLSNQLWDGNLQTRNHGVLGQNPVGVDEYIEDTNPDTDTKESFNSAYNLIQPVLNKSDLFIPKKKDDPEGHAAAKDLNEVEAQKYAYKAGLVISVDDAGDISYNYYRRRTNGNIRYESDDGTPRTRDLEPVESIATFHPFVEVDGTIESGMHEKRQAQDLNIVEIDISKLKDLVHSNDKDDWGTKNFQAPDQWWNGVVYVEFPTQNETSSRPDNVNPAKDGWALKLVNGNVIPNPSFAHANDNYGMALATNQMMYIEGNYNADGDKSTGSPVLSDDPGNFGKEGHEAPAALIADSLTFLSVNWDDQKSKESLSQRTAADTEVSAAILTGLVPSGEEGTKRYSGGVENFPRFLENWGGKNLRIRGSMVALFESEVGTRGWGYGDVYGAPNRDWGFHSKFAEGYLPPGTPNTRRYRAVDFQVVDKATYDSHVDRIKTYF
ncbi:MAG: hypothetical protein AAF065_14230 [Verrucomicrobiota bacterium]